jgi:gamma-glutamyltranspeptidase/glutathione hydrolase
MQINPIIPETTFNSRRAPVLARRGVVSTSQPLAAQAGLSILMQGGNAADAAVATAAALNVTEPTSTGIGGDCFALYYEAATGAITALTVRAGRRPASLSICSGSRGSGQSCRLFTRTPSQCPAQRPAGAIWWPGTAA